MCPGPGAVTPVTANRGAHFTASEPVEPEGWSAEAPPSLVSSDRLLLQGFVLSKFASIEKQPRQQTDLECACRIESSHCYLIFSNAHYQRCGAQYGISSFDKAKPKDLLFLSYVLHRIWWRNLLYYVSQEYHMNERISCCGLTTKGNTSMLNRIYNFSLKLSLLVSWKNSVHWIEFHNLVWLGLESFKKPIKGILQPAPVWT